MKTFTLTSHIIKFYNKLKFIGVIIRILTHNLIPLLANNKVMNEVINVKVEEVIDRNPSWLAHNHDVAVIKLEDLRIPDSNKNLKIRLEALSIIIVLDGTIDININGNDYHFESNVLFDIAKLHTFSNLKISPDCRGYHVVLSSDFTKDIMSSIRRISVSTFISRYNYPIEMLNSTESNLLEEMILRIIKSIKRVDHNFHSDLVKNDVRCFIIEVMNIISFRNETQSNNEKHYKDKLVGKFMFLLDEHCKEERNVEFYAKTLCVDSKYLSRVLKSYNGKTATAWIAEALLKEAKMYLRDPEVSIQQVADRLNFSDQSSFGKFFKKQSGISPMNFKIASNE